MIRVVIIGSGNIGTDLGERLLQSPDFQLVALIGRRTDSPGIKRFVNRVEWLGEQGLQNELARVDGVDGFFDASSAKDHVNHWELLKLMNKWVIDLTPSRVGKPIVPTLVGKLNSMKLSESDHANYSMVTCGGQSSGPIIYSLIQCFSEVIAVEVSSSIASKSAGPATRRNIDEYISSTEDLIKEVSGCKQAKAILVLNPSTPPVHMRTTVTIQGSGIDLENAKLKVREEELLLKSYIPGFDIITEPFLLNESTLTMTVSVKGSGYFLPPFAGNLDIINSAAVETARLHVANLMSVSQRG